MARIPRLTEMLQNSPQFNDPETEDFVTVDKQAVYLKLAELFQGKISNLYSDPEELAVAIPSGTVEAWEDFLNLAPVGLYIGARTKNLASVTARKSLKNLQKSANMGDVPAIKYLNEVSGILNAQAGEKTIVLTCVPRPKNTPKELKSK